VARTDVKVQVFKMGMEGQFQIWAGKNFEIEVLVQFKRMGTF